MCYVLRYKTTELINLWGIWMAGVDSINHAVYPCSVIQLWIESHVLKKVGRGLNAPLSLFHIGYFEFYDCSMYFLKEGVLFTAEVWILKSILFPQKCQDLVVTKMVKWTQIPGLFLTVQFISATESLNVIYIWDQQ